MAITNQIPSATKAHLLAALYETPDRIAIEVIREYANERLSWSYGFDQIDSGLDRCLADMDDEEERSSAFSSRQDFTKGVVL